MEFECVHDGVMPKEFEVALLESKPILCKTSIGWIEVDIESVEDFRNNVKYKIKG